MRTSGVLTCQGKRFVFDTGPDFRMQMLNNRVDVLDGVIFTHKHKDHTAGLDDVRAYNFLLRRDMDIYANADTLQHLKREYYYIFEQPDYPGLPQLKLHHIENEPFQASGVTFTPVPVMHRKLEVWGYRVGDFAYITDANLIPPSSQEKLKNLDVLILNALRLSPHPSHFSLQEALHMVEHLNPRRAYFTHISHFMGTHEEASLRLPANVALAYDGLEVVMEDTAQLEG